jgi:hypothetical protein
MGIADTKLTFKFHGRGLPTPTRNPCGKLMA